MRNSQKFSPAKETHYTVLLQLTSSSAQKGVSKISPTSFQVASKWCLTWDSTYCPESTLPIHDTGITLHGSMQREIGAQASISQRTILQWVNKLHEKQSNAHTWKYTAIFLWWIFWKQSVCSDVKLIGDDLTLVLWTYISIHFWGISQVLCVYECNFWPSPGGMKIEE